ncbi:hypothetical protein [uncultured Desulfovibrio sp.]|uniref:hypothetical protein n=1 Tax=uncultured Desulfovibrio sp. TaxID=167968 RepID=UPI002639FA63|nr:hypothetical protein [uncultured Desulfovibrio sp.]
MSDFSLLGVANLVGIVCAALAFLLYLRDAARRLDVKEEESGPPSVPGETAAPPSPVAASQQVVSDPVRHETSEESSTAACQARRGQQS